MTTRPRWRPPVAITTNRWLREELQHCERDAGTELVYTTTVPEVRRRAYRSPMVIIGVELAGRVRKPFTRADLVVIAGLSLADHRMFTHAVRLCAHYVVELPTARAWLAGRLLQAESPVATPDPPPSDDAHPVGVRC